MDQPPSPAVALQVRRPWSGLIVDGLKTWEIRSNPTRKRCRICIAEVGTRSLLGEVDIQGCIAIDLSDVLHTNHGLHRIYGVRGIPRGKTLYAWQLANAYRYPEPVPFTLPHGAVQWVKI